MRAAALLCALPAVFASDLQLSASEIDTVLAAMNNARSDRGACPLTWDATLVSGAVTRTGADDDSKCPISCGAGTTPCGPADSGEWQYTAIFDTEFAVSQESADMTGVQVLSARVNTWTDSNAGEAGQYEQNGQTTASAHYQKLVNKKASKVGCAVCLGSVSRAWGLDQWHFVLCVYDEGQDSAVPAANIGNKGDQCDKCEQLTCNTPPSQCHSDQGTCLSTVGECEYAMKADDTVCDDGNADTTGDVCVSGNCVGYDKCASVTCTASPCYDPGVCDPKTGTCTPKPWKVLITAGGDSGLDNQTVEMQTISCDDGDDKTTNDVCECTQQKEAGSVFMVCTGTCSGTDQCSQDPPVNHAGCSPPTCHTCVDCCDHSTGECKWGFEAKDTPCDDGRVDTRNDQCDGNGNCVGTDVCLTQTGEHIRCLSSTVGIRSCLFQGVCNPADLDSHGVAKCKFSQKAAGAACDDGDALTTHDVCVATSSGGVECRGTALCEYPTKVVCDPPDQCHLPGVCDPNTGKCTNPSKDISIGDASSGSTKVTCDDGDGETVDDQCQWVGQEYTCMGINLCLDPDSGNPKDCGPPRTQCHQQPLCNFTTGECYEVLKSDGTQCDDGSDLTVSDACQATGATDATCVGVDKCAGKGVNGARKTCDAQPNTPELACRTKGFCEPATGECNYDKAEFNVAAGETCDDGDAGTVNDRCAVDAADGLSKCVGEKPCKSEVVEVTPGVWVCPFQPWADAGVSQDCNEAYCNPATNKCDLRAYSRSSGVSCDDGDAVTVEDVCTPAQKQLTVSGKQVDVTVGSCAGVDKCGQKETPPRQCPVRNNCYSPGQCDPATGRCLYAKTPVGQSCDDGDAKTTGDKCQSIGNDERICVGVDLCAGIQCTSPGQCQTSGNCDAQTGVCSYPNAKSGTVCDDGNAATMFDTCDGNNVCAGIDLCAGIVCKAASQCHDVGTCEPTTGLCTNPVKQQGAQCDDGEAKTVNDVCGGTADPTCKGTNLCLDAQTGGNKVCPAASQCHEAGQCQYADGSCTTPAKAKGARCDDGDDTTKDDVCDGAASPVCKGTPKCDGVVCTAAAGSACHEAGSCDPKTGKCVCATKLPWTQMGCEKSGATCDDGLAETVEDRCGYDQFSSFGCHGTNKCAGITCKSLGQCYNVGECDHQTGKCSQPFKKSGVACDDGDDSTVFDSCDGKGNCKGLDLCKGIVCDAPNDCYTAGTCDPQTGSCSYPKKPDGSPCDDADPASVLDKCIGGKCTGTQPCGNKNCTSTKKCYVGFCEVKRGSNGQPDVNSCSERPGEVDVPCDDEDLTTKDDMCKLEVGAEGEMSAKCVGTPKCDGVTCTAPTDCHDAGACDPTTGVCKPVAKAAGTACDDGDDKTVFDKCDGKGNCEGINLCLGISCQPRTACMQWGTCQPADGQCVYNPKPKGETCDDGDANTVFDQCDGSGECKGIDLCAGVTCPKRGSCEEDGVCDHSTGACKWKQRPEGVSCDDGDSKTQADKCTKDGQCVGVNLCEGIVCREEPCFGAGVCDYATGVCTKPQKPAETLCDDGDADTVEDKCDAQGKCKGVNKCLDQAGQPKVCAAIDDCHEAGVCDKFTGRCSTPNKPDNTACDDGNDRTVEDVCSGGRCHGTDKCLGKLQECTTDWVTQNPQCNKQGTCDINTGTCTNPYVDDGTACDDGNPSTVNDICHKGQCKGYDPCQDITCDPINSCHQSASCVVDQQTQKPSCVQNPKAADTPCDDAQAFTVNDKCRSVGNKFVCAGVPPCGGGCTPSTSPCKSVRCVVDQANPEGQCVESNLANGLKCDDGDANTVLDSCKAGTCQGINLCAGITCSIKSDCHTLGVCQPLTGVCTNPAKQDGTQCDDGDQWTGNDACKAGRCVGVDLCKARTVDKNGRACGFKNSCYSRGTCQPLTGLCDDGQPRGAGKHCDDGDSSTIGDVCVADAAGGNGALKCAGQNPCDSVTCVASNQCHEVGTCSVVNKQPKCSDVRKPPGTPCDDGDAHTVNDKCAADGGCHGEDLCANKPPCRLPAKAHPTCNTIGVCDFTTGKCTKHQAKVGGNCDDGNARTIADKCVLDGEVGVCRGTDLCASIKCPAATQCRSNGFCNPQTGGCEQGRDLPLGTPCDDGDLATTNDSCTAGVCKGVDVCASVTCPAPKDTCSKQGKCDPRRFKVQNGGYSFRSNVRFSFSSTMTTSYSASSAAGSISHTTTTSATFDFSFSTGLDATVGSTTDPDGLCTAPAEPDLTVCDDGEDDTIADQCISGSCRGISCNIQVLSADWGNDSCTWGTRGEGGGYGWTPDGNLYVDGTCGGTFLIEATGETIVCPADGQYKECRRSLLLQSKQARSDIRDIWQIIKKGVNGQPGCVPTPEVPGCKKNSCWIDQGKGCCQDAKKKAFASFTKGSLFNLNECLALAEDYQGKVVGIEWEAAAKKCRLLVVGGATLSDPTGGWLETSPGDGLAPVSGASAQSCPNTQCLSPKNRCIGVTCTKAGDCTKKGHCEGHSGKCTNPAEVQGSTCDDGDASTINDVCDGDGKCTGTNPPGCFVRWQRTPAQTCRHDQRRCSDAWGQTVWGTMEECCRPGNAHPTGCAPAPPPSPTDCWRASKWFPTRECTNDPDACSWGNWGEGIFASKDECCTPGKAFPCGCSKPPGPPRKCFVKSTTSYDAQGRWTRECVDDQTRCGDSSGVYPSREKCCDKEWAPYGCTLPCKALDVVIVLDGSGSMRGRFGLHPHGFYGVISMLKDWVGRLPLTGEKAGRGLVSLPNGGVRVGLVQFSGQNPYYGRRGYSQAIKTPSRDWRGMLTAGRLSGDKDELLRDIAWHRDHFMSRGTMIRRGLELASQMFEDKTPGRQRVVILITDGRIYDERELRNARQMLDAKRAMVFGVVVRKSRCHTRTDTEAERVLKPILSGIIDEHFYNIEIEDVPGKVLNGMCDPNSQWGAYLKPEVKNAVAKLPANVAKTATGQAPIWDRQRKLKPFPDLDCDELVKDPENTCGCTEPLAGTIVSIESPGFDKRYDRLMCSGCRRLGIYAEWRASVGMLYLKGNNKNLGHFTAAIREVEFYSQARDTKPRVFTYNFGEGWGTSTSQGQFYQYYPHRRIQWDAAQQQCEKKKILGMPGYLMTVTTEAEQKLATQKLAGEGWMGASDAGKEREWRWVTGPEGCPPDASCNKGDGMRLSQWKRGRGTASGASTGGEFFFKQGSRGGVAQAGCTDKVNGKCFTNWAPGEPNEYRYSCAGDCRCCGEDFAHFWWPQGTWNDFPKYHSEIHGYICEWGGIGKPCLKTPLHSKEYIHSAVYKPPPPAPPVVDKCSLPVEKPDPLPAGGCANPWELTPAGSKAGWTEADCDSKCVLPSGSQLSLECRDTSGRGQMCRCPRGAATAQCSCGSWENGLGKQEEEYCATKERFDSINGKKCYPPVESEFTIAGEAGWDSDDSYYGVAPATQADDDSTFSCRVYDRANLKWATSTFDGQCQDKDQMYFSRYQTAVLTDSAEQSCKKLCESPARPECHSIHWGLAATDDDKELCKRLQGSPGECSICTLNVHAPSRKCAPNQILCRRPQTTPTPGEKCGCAKYGRGADKHQTRFCTRGMNTGPGVNECRPTNADGTCNSGWDSCGGATVQSLPCKAGKCTDPTVIAGVIGGGANVPPTSIVVQSICPASVCLGGSCKTAAQKKAAGCAVLQWKCGNSWETCGAFRNQATRNDPIVCRKRQPEQGVHYCLPPNRGDGKCPGDHDRCQLTIRWPDAKTSARHASALANEDTRVEAKINDADAVAALNGAVQASQAGVPNADPALAAMFSGTSTSEPSAADVTTEDAPAVAVDPNASPASPNSPDSSSDDGFPLAGIIGLVAGGCVLTAMLGLFVHRRQAKVRWTDVAVRRDSVTAEDIGVITPAGDKHAASSYQEMQASTAKRPPSPSLLGPSKADDLLSAGEHVRKGSSHSLSAHHVEL
eukprot:TRINITY_DN22_c1_g2_i1.p1 TRINITY_DN22_c1_g2~~TRINITY_DN22_c1_g2_i1.p1  ORF type:complete len:3968 (+),score=1484.88 TRINITY_DN22_c1_g2_i1:103-11904(+)